jgi:hypothetical protein
LGPDTCDNDTRQQATHNLTILTYANMQTSPRQNIQALSNTILHIRPEKNASTSQKMQMHSSKTTRMMTRRDTAFSRTMLDKAMNAQRSQRNQRHDPRKIFYNGFREKSDPSSLCSQQCSCPKFHGSTNGGATQHQTAYVLGVSLHYIKPQPYHPTNSGTS